MIKVPVSSKIATASWPRPGITAYVFSVRGHGGQVLGTDVEEFDSTFQLDARRSLVSFESFRSEADIAGTPIGVFRLPVDDQKVKEFHQLVISGRLFGDLPAMTEHPGYTERSYLLAEADKPSLKRVINDSHADANTVIDPLVKAIRALRRESIGHPERAVLLGLAGSRQPAGDVFELTVTNIGIEKVCFTDPRWVTPTGPLQQSVVRLAEFPEQRPGESEPLDWKSIPLPPMEPRPEREPLVTLDPGGVWKAKTAPHRTAPGKRHLAFFTWASYAGEPMVDGVYRIRGRTDSARLVIAP